MSAGTGAPSVAVVGGDAGGGPELAMGLEQRGASVATLNVQEMRGRAEVRSALEAVARRVGALDAVVVVSVGSESTHRGALAALDADAWKDRVELPLARTLGCFQGAFTSLRTGGGTLVLLVPTLSLHGTAGFVGWAAVTEGQRALAKAAARAWGHDGVTVNCVAVPAALLAVPSSEGGRGETSAGPLDRPGLPTPALASPGMRGEVAAVVHTLLSSAMRSVTGATVGVDGGVWMTP
jgi:3-oxoacyl-[acyl-carrier protein] reductase